MTLAHLCRHGGWLRDAGETREYYPYLKLYATVTAIWYFL